MISTASSHSCVSSYAAYTSSSKSKIRETRTPSKQPSVLIFEQSSLSKTCLVVNSQRHRDRSVASLETRTMPTSKDLTKSHSTKSLTLPTTTMQQPKSRTLDHVTISHITRCPSNLAASSNRQLSSRTKANQTKENLEKKQYSHSTNDLRTCILNGNNNIYTNNDNNLTEIKVKQSLSIPDLRKMQQEPEVSSPSVAEPLINDPKQDDPITHDDRMLTVNHLVHDLHQCLNELENLYASVAQSSDIRDTMLKQNIEQIYFDLHIRITNNQQQQQKQACAIVLADFQQQALLQHNYYRQLHCIDAMVLNSTISKIAQTYANYLAANNLFQHSGTSGLGENLWAIWSSGAIRSVNGSSPTNSWYSEISSYNFGSPGFSSSTGHFTQVIWKGSKQLGIGIAFTSDNRTAYVVANYYPPGNLKLNYS
ncbi:unnamed protein product [Rotaria sp. Silwood1]|nr:unnamed protein product [Rotaria sp. Silwood1]CAF1535625.1 unnamed protein product [Rotaria sp. Silwood1]